MRIQLNKIGLSPVEYSAGIVPRGDRWKLWTPSEVVVAHFCKKCGAELYGKWTWRDFTYDRNKFEDELKWHRERESPKFDQLNQQHELIRQAVANCRSDLEAIRHEKDIIRDMASCPCCGESLIHEDGYLAIFGYSYSLIERKDQKHSYEAYGLKYASELDVDAIFSAMRNYRSKEQKNDAAKKVDIKTSQYTSDAPHSSIPNQVCIGEHPEQLKEYLLKLVETETSILSLTQRLQTLYFQHIDAERNAYGSTLSLLVDAKSAVETAEGNLRQCKNNHNALLSKVLDPINLPAPKRPVKPTEPLYEQPGFFNKKRVLAENAERKAQYEQAFYQYEVAMDQYYPALESWKQQVAQLTKQQEEAHQYNIMQAQRSVEEAEEKLATAKNAYLNFSVTSADIATPEKAHKALLDNEIHQAEELLQKAIHCRHQLYSYNVIFGKYRNIVAVSTMYEYLMSGRCSSLEGTNGAYNLYESELRANIIISQLSSVLESLEKIKDNQYMIYEAVQNVNASLCHLESTMEAAAKSLSNIEANSETMTKYMGKIANNSDVIAHNTAVTAHYSKINAELTNALGYMVALR